MARNGKRRKCITSAKQIYKIYMQLLDKKNAINVLKNYLDKNEYDIELLQMLAETYFLSDQKENGFETLQKISKIFSEEKRHGKLLHYST